MRFPEWKTEADQMPRVPATPKPHKAQIGFPIQVGKINAKVYGGPYVNRPPNMWGILLAKEIDLPYNVRVLAQDFGLPSQGDMELGVLQTFVLLRKHPRAYAGCMGGIGRTGTFLGCLAKTLIDVQGIDHRGRYDPVSMVRAFYLRNAIETKAQEQFVREFDSSRIHGAIKAVATV